MNLQQTIEQLYTALSKNKFSKEELLETALDVINKKDSDINAFVEVYKDIETNSTKDTLLSGIPMGIKDNILYKGRGASAASKILENYTASYDSHVVSELKKHGATIVGRLNMDDSAMGTSTESSYYGPTKNPIDLTRVPGGSSGGPAAAVAAGMVNYSLGSDTGGSIRQPAAMCGVVGLKPSYGSVSRNGLIAMASSLDVIGPITNNVRDAEIVFNAINTYDPLDSTCIPEEKRAPFKVKNVNNKVIGVPRSFVNGEGVSDEVKANFQTSLDALRDAGYTMVDIELPHIQYALAVYYILQPAEASSNLARYDGVRFGLHKDGATLEEMYKNTKGEGFGKEVQRRIMLGTYVLSSGYHDEYYYKAQKLRKKITDEIKKAFEKVDIIATPTAPSLPFKFGEKKDPITLYLEDIFTVPYNLSGNPAISIPSGFNDNGLPFSMHFTAPMFCEEKLFEVGKDFERAIL